MSRKYLFHIVISILTGCAKTNEPNASLSSSPLAVPCSFFHCWVFALESPRAVHYSFIWLHSLLAAGLHTLRLAVALLWARYGGHRHFVFYAYFVFSPILALTDHRFIPLPCYHQARQNSP